MSLKFCKRDSCDSYPDISPVLASYCVKTVSQLANEVNDFNYPSSACSLPSLQMQRRKLNMVCLSGPDLGLSPAWPVVHDFLNNPVYRLLRLTSPSRTAGDNVGTSRPLFSFSRI